MKHRLVVVDAESHLIPEPWIEGYTTLKGATEQEAAGAWIARERQAAMALGQLKAYVESHALTLASAEGDHQQNRGQ